jgi:hypothetical protein
LVERLIPIVLHCRNFLLLTPIFLLMQHSSTEGAWADEGNSVYTYQIGDIPNITSRDTAVVTFRIEPKRLHDAGIKFSVEADPKPLGDYKIEPQTGLFTYTPDPADKADISIIFRAEPTPGTTGEPETQRVTLTRSISLPPEARLVDPPQSGGPNPESPDYITVSVKHLSPKGRFNTIANATTREFIVSGDVVVLEEQHENGLYERLNFDPESNPREAASRPNADIRAVTINAGAVIIRSPLRMPQARVVINAADLTFEDADAERPAKLDTSPLGFATAPAALANGNRGEDASDVELHVLRVNIKPQPGVSLAALKRFVLRGGTGQMAGPGQPGADGPNLKDYSPVWCNPIPHGFCWPAPPGTIGIQRGDRKRLLVGTWTWPDGGEAKPGGRPGNGGSGGNLASLLL